MMTLAHALLAIGAYFLWRHGSRWGWNAVMLALMLGGVIFMRDVDFSSALGVRL